MDSSYTSASTKPLYHGNQIIWYVLGVIEVGLAFRFVLKLFEANAGSGFVDFVYGVTGFLVAPFVSVFSTTNVTGNIFEWTTILAMFVYWVLAYGLSKLLRMGKTVSTAEAASELNSQEN